MQCPFCGGESQVSDSRSTGDSDNPGRDQIRRRRVCTSCKRRFTTYERIGAPSLKVAKRGGKTEEFSSAKLRRCLHRVCKGRPITDDVLVGLVNGIEADLIDANIKKVPSWLIAERLLTRLRGIDTLAWNRLLANYVDEDGVLRLRPGSEIGDSESQLGLFDSDSDAD